jgi:hypothetical protein
MERCDCGHHRGCELWRSGEVVHHVDSPHRNAQKTILAMQLALGGPGNPGFTSFTPRPLKLMGDAHLRQPMDGWLAIITTKATMISIRVRHGRGVKL